MTEKYYLGIDIGTYETKGVLVNVKGEVIAQSAKTSCDLSKEKYLNFVWQIVHILSVLQYTFSVY